jgi:hypothetical protein
MSRLIAALKTNFSRERFRAAVRPATADHASREVRIPYQGSELNDFGGHTGGVTPDPISNSEVKTSRADGTAGEALWESRSPPGTFERPGSSQDPGLFFGASGRGPPRRGRGGLDRGPRARGRSGRVDRSRAASPPARRTGRCGPPTGSRRLQCGDEGTERRQVEAVADTEATSIGELDLEALMGVRHGDRRRAHLDQR